MLHKTLFSATGTSSRSRMSRAKRSFFHYLQIEVAIIKCVVKVSATRGQHVGNPHLPSHPLIVFSFFPQRTPNSNSRRFNVFQEIQKSCMKGLSVHHLDSCLIKYKHINPKRSNIEDSTWHLAIKSSSLTD